MAGEMRLSGSGGRPDAEVELPDKWRRAAAELQATVASLPAGLVRCSPRDPPIRALAALHRDGAVVIERAVSRDTCERVIEEMRPYVDTAATGDGFLGRQTQRASAVVSRSPASWEIIRHPLLLEICEGVLSRQLLHLRTEEDLAKWLAPGSKRFPFQLSLSQVIRIGGGNRWQPLHRDGWTFLLDLAGVLETEVSTIWALSDFTEENGATRVSLGSHRSPSGAKPQKAEAVQAAMPAGSVVIYLGNTWHSGGENRTDSQRWGLNVDYNLACLRQEENQFLACPPEIARTLPEDIQVLLGYTMPGTSFGYFAEYQHPREALRPQERPLNWATRHLRGFAAGGARARL